MLLVGFVMERGLIKHFYKRPHADQILVTFGLAIVLQELVKHYYGANPIQTGAPTPSRARSTSVFCWVLIRTLSSTPTGVWSISALPP